MTQATVTYRCAVCSSRLRKVPGPPPPPWKSIDFWSPRWGAGEAVVCGKPTCVNSLRNSR